MKVAERANDAVKQTAASAAAVVETENDKKMREAEQSFWKEVNDGGADAAPAPKKKKKPR
jgi:hypothetical protein